MSDDVQYPDEEAGIATIAGFGQSTMDKLDMFTVQGRTVVYRGYRSGSHVLAWTSDGWYLLVGGDLAVIAEVEASPDEAQERAKLEWRLARQGRRDRSHDARLKVHEDTPLSGRYTSRDVDTGRGRP